VMAGMHMASSMNRDIPTCTYARQRLVRLFPEVAVVWLATLAFVIAGRGTAGMHWFLGTAPFQLQNLTPLFFQYNLPRDAVFGPLWFLGSLFQLQVVLHALRKRIGTANPVWIIAIALILGVSGRLLFAIWRGHARELDGTSSGILYCMPFCHLEAIVLGVVLGRGGFPGLGRLLPWCVGLIAGAGLLNVWFSGGRMGIASLGFEFPPRINGSHLWAYPLLALGSGALCAKDGPLAARLDRAKLPAWIERCLSTLAPLTYGVYCFHGLIIATGINFASVLSRSSTGRTAVFAITLLEAFLCSALVSQLWRRLPPLWRGSTGKS